MPGRKEELSILVRLQDFASRSLARVGKSVTSFGRSSVNAFRRVARQAFSLKGALVTAFGGGSISALTTYAGEIEQVEQSYRSLTASIGQDSEEILSSIRRGFRGAISESEALKQANTALLFGIAETPQEFEELATIARRLGAAVGKDATESFSDFTTALARGSPQILDNLGIQLKLTDSYEIAAEKLGKTVEELTDAEKSQAFLTAALEKGREAVARLGPDVDTLQTEWGSLKAELRDVADTVLKSLAPSLQQGIGGFADLVQEKRPVILGFFASVVEGFGSLSAAGIEFLSEFQRQFGNIEAFVQRFRVLVLEIKIQTDEFAQGLRESAVGGFLSQVGAAFAGVDESAEESTKSLAEWKEETEALRREQRRLVGEIFEGSEERADALRVTADLLRENTRAAAAALRGGRSRIEIGESPITIAAREARKRLAAEAVEVKPELAGVAEEFERITDATAERTPITFLEGLGDAANRLEARIQSVGEITSDVAVAGVEGLSTGLSRGFFDAATGARNAEQAFTQFGQSFLRQIGEMILQQTIFNSLSRGFNAIPGVGGFFARQFGGAFSSTGRPRQFAFGGVNGTIAGPGFTSSSVFGEGSRAELYIPLNNGRVPVEIQGGIRRFEDPPNVNVTIVNPQVQIGRAHV